MPTADSIVYLKKSLRSLWQHPRLSNLLSNMKYYHEWRAHLKPGRNSVDDQKPWISFSAIDFLEKIVDRNMRVFEYGSGGSTMFWTSRVKELVSVEHDLFWYSNMKKKIDELSLHNVRYVLSEPEQDANYYEKRFENPSDFISSDKAYAGKNFEKYARIIDSFPDDYFDIVIVDGRVRPSCVQQSLPKLKKGGWLIIDNSERKYYTAPFSFDRKSWKISIFAGAVPYTKDFSETSFLNKLI
jgi:hypothetical protein